MTNFLLRHLLGLHRAMRGVDEGFATRQRAEAAP